MERPGSEAPPAEPPHGPGNGVPSHRREHFRRRRSGSLLLITHRDLWVRISSGSSLSPGPRLWVQSVPVSVTCVGPTVRGGEEDQRVDSVSAVRVNSSYWTTLDHERSDQEVHISHEDHASV